MFPSVLSLPWQLQWLLWLQRKLKKPEIGVAHQQPKWNKNKNNGIHIFSKCIPYSFCTLIDLDVCFLQIQICSCKVNHTRDITTCSWKLLFSLTTCHLKKYFKYKIHIFMRSIFYIMCQLLVGWVVMKRIKYVWFQLHVKCKLYWTNMNQNQSNLTTFNVDPLIPSFIKIHSVVTHTHTHTFQGSVSL